MRLHTYIWTESMSIPPGVLIADTCRSGAQGESSSRHTWNETNHLSEDWHHGGNASIHPWQSGEGTGLCHYLLATWSTSPFPLNLVPHQERRAERTLPNLLQHLVLLHSCHAPGSGISCRLDDVFKANSQWLCQGNYLCQEMTCGRKIREKLSDGDVVSRLRTASELESDDCEQWLKNPWNSSQFKLME